MVEDRVWSVPEFIVESPHFPTREGGAGRERFCQDLGTSLGLLPAQAWKG